MCRSRSSKAPYWRASAAASIPSRRWPTKRSARPASARPCSAARQSRPECAPSRPLLFADSSIPPWIREVSMGADDAKLRDAVVLAVGENIVLRAWQPADAAGTLKLRKAERGGRGQVWVARYQKESE